MLEGIFGKDKKVESKPVEPAETDPRVTEEDAEMIERVMDQAPVVAPREETSVPDGAGENLHPVKSAEEVASEMGAESNPHGYEEVPASPDTTAAEDGAEEFDKAA